MLPAVKLISDAFIPTNLFLTNISLGVRSLAVNWTVFNSTASLNLCDKRVHTSFLNCNGKRIGVADIMLNYSSLNHALEL